MPAIVGPDGKWDPAHVERFLARGGWQDVQGMQAPSAQAVTGLEERQRNLREHVRRTAEVVRSWPPHMQREAALSPPADLGHGECCCSECETGWAAAWAEWVGR